MFEFLIWAVVAVISFGMCWAYVGSRDVFHPLMLVGPMLLFVYAWMPLKLNSSGGLDGFFQRDQLQFVQLLILGGITCFVLGCLSVGCRVPTDQPPDQIPLEGLPVLLIGGTLMGFVGLAAWAVQIINVGGIYDAFSQSYGGGWDDNGYVRDASLLMFPAFLLILGVSVRTGFRITYLFLMILFIAPWMVQAVFTSRRGPTFMITIILALGWYMNRWKRPSLAFAGAAGLLLGFLLLFLVTNRGNIYLGSDQQFTTEVTSIVEKPDTGNEYIYGAGSILSAEQRNTFFWGRRLLAQIVVRPIPHTIWPTKYEDFGVPELTHNAGTGEGFSETLGWEGASGSAPAIIADLWMEFRWLTMPVLWVIGRLYARVWQKTHLIGGPWITQYIIVAALSIYFVMQTMEAVVFRLLILSLPMWTVWRIARQLSKPAVMDDFGGAEQGIATVV